MSSHDEQRPAVPTAPPSLPPPDMQRSQYPPHHHTHYPPPGHGYPPQQGWHHPQRAPTHSYPQQPPAPSLHRSDIKPANSHKQLVNESPAVPAVLHDAKAIKDPSENEPKVDPMRQDFHFYGEEQYNTVMEECKRKLQASNLLTVENEVYLTNTLLNATLIHNWETAPQSTRTHYLKLEEGDRKRFMSEDEVASRHCATLTARKRSPKMNAGETKEEGAVVGKARSFGLGEVVPQMVGVLSNENEVKVKRPVE